MQMQLPHLTVHKTGTGWRRRRIDPCQEGDDLFAEQGLHLQGLNPNQLLTELKQVIAVAFASLTFDADRREMAGTLNHHSATARSRGRCHEQLQLLIQGRCDQVERAASEQDRNR